MVHQYITMSDWDLLTPGIGLTAIGVAGVGVSLSGIAKTFMDGMHAVTFLTMLIGIIFLSSGLFKDGFPRSAKAKSAALIVLGFLVTFGITFAILGSSQTPSILTYIGIMLVIAIPGTILSIMSYKRTPHFRALSIIFIAGALVGIITFVVFGMVTPKIQSPDESTEVPVNTSNANIPANIVEAKILAGSSAEGNPDYEPDQLEVKADDGIRWVNEDNAPHTVTSLKDDGQSFDSSIIPPQGNYTLDVSTLTETNYEYFCLVHPYMRASFTIER